MKTKQTKNETMKVTKTVGRLIVGCVFACCLPSNSHAQSSLTPEQIAARRAAAEARTEEMTRQLDDAMAQAMAEAQAQAAARPVRTVTQTAAQQVTIAEAQQADFQANYAPWIVQDVSMPDGSQITADGLQNLSESNLLVLSSNLSAGYLIQQADVSNYAATNAIGMPASWTDYNGVFYIIDHLEDGAPAIKQTHNLESAQTVGAQKLWPGGSTGFNLTATNLAIGLVDGGNPLTNHQEFIKNGLRVSEIFGPSQYGTIDHATHTCGTIAAWGVSNAATGFANRATVWATDFNNDLAKMPTLAVTNGGVRESNHSYGYSGGWYIFTPDGVNYYWFWNGDIVISTNWDWNFGFYNTVAQTNDEIIYTAQTYLPVFSAGNANDPNDDGPATQPFGHYEYSNNVVIISSGIRPLNNAQGGFNTLTAYAVSKNNLVVGAVGANTNGYTGTNSVSIANFASRGSTADGRIKPDLVADGVNVYSTFAGSNTAYALDSGTSMSAPAVTGTLGLLSSFYKQLYPTNAPLLLSSAPLASTLRGLVIHTADQLGNTIGPSYTYGWGLLDAVAAASLITNNYASDSLAFVKEVRLNSGDYVQFPVVLTNGKPFKVTITWTDPPGTPTARALNPTNHMLVNDLDLRFVNPSGVTNFPWVLNRNTPTNAATTGDNTVDNVEQISIPNPTNGTYLVQVTHKGNLVNDLGQTSYQNLSILLSGNIAQPPIPPTITSISALTISDSTALKWASDVGRIYRVQYRNDLASGSWQYASGELSATKTNTAFTVSTAGASSQFYRIVQVR
jgi:Subtilase family